MLKHLTIALVSVLMLGTASAAMAQSAKHGQQQSYACQTDEGYGRTVPCDVGGGN